MRRHPGYPSLAERLYTVEMIPSTWRSAFVIPHHKANTDPRPWRHTGGGSHCRRTYARRSSRALFAYMHGAGYLDMHPLQFGFRRGIDVPEAIWCADELTSYCDHANAR